MGNLVSPSLLIIEWSGLSTVEPVPLSVLSFTKLKTCGTCLIIFPCIYILKYPQKVVWDTLV